MSLRVCVNKGEGDEGMPIGRANSSDTLEHRNDIVPGAGDSHSARRTKVHRPRNAAAASVTCVMGWVVGDIKSTHPCRVGRRRGLQFNCIQFGDCQLTDRYNTHHRWITPTPEHTRWVWVGTQMRKGTNIYMFGKRSRARRRFRASL